MYTSGEAGTMADGVRMGVRFGDALLVGVTARGSGGGTLRGASSSGKETSDASILPSKDLIV